MKNALAYYKANLAKNVEMDEVELLLRQPSSQPGRPGVD
jgi:hypothetical protein